MVRDPIIRFMLTGATGQLGFELQRALSPLGEVVALDRTQCDLADAQSIAAAVARYAPQVIVNAAAWTAVDLAESEPGKAMAVNAEAPALLARAAQACGALLVHYSSDYVFDGKKAEPYSEEDSPAPLSVYGHSKLAGERAVASQCDRYLIFRTSWVYGAYGANFMKTVLRLASSRDSLRMVADQFGAPTGAALISDVTAQVLARYLHACSPGAFPFGLYHLSAAGETSWHQYARFVLAQAAVLQMPLTLGESDVEPIPAEAYPLPAERPQNSRLDTAKLQQTFGLVLPPWQAGVSHAMRLLA
jgi:dTDP-4-dehydrorhamnose reductase